MSLDHLVPERTVTDGNYYTCHGEHCINGIVESLCYTSESNITL